MALVSKKKERAMTPKASSLHSATRLLALLAFLLGKPPVALAQAKARDPDSNVKELIERCTPVLVTQPNVKHDSLQIRGGEKPTGFSPLVTFQIVASGEVTNVRLKRSSGFRDIDRLALGYIKSHKYNDRPGCPVIESQAGVTVDF